MIGADPELRKPDMRSWHQPLDPDGGILPHPVIAVAGLHASDGLEAIGGVLSPGSAIGIFVRGDSVLYRTERLLPQSLELGLLPRALAMWCEHTPDGGMIWQEMDKTLIWLRLS